MASSFLLVGLLLCLDVFSCANVPVMETLDSVESLEASKILLDHTSPLPHWLTSFQNAANFKVTPSFPIMKEAQSENTAPGESATENAKMENEIREDMQFPLLVAQCRAVCLEKFSPITTSSSKLPVTQTDRAISSPESGKKTTMERSKAKLPLLPNILRFRRRRGAAPANSKVSTSPFSCFEDSSDCRSCWENCQILETNKPQPSALNSTSDTVVEPETSNPPRHSTRCTDSVGCQVASAFYEKLEAIKGNQAGERSKDGKKNNEAVVATKMESVLEISERTIAWPKAATDDDDDGSSGNELHVVYVVLKECPDKKWRQITQTTGMELAIPNDVKEWVPVRVLVVGVTGLRSVYGPAKPQRENGKGSTPEESQMAVNAQVIGSDLVSSHQRSGKSLANPITVVDSPFNLQLVSLIHQNSLVIVELCWNEIEDSQEQQNYLVTWELNGGGLKGHLVTDSTSVTLSLWPDTFYHVQVEQFVENLDSDGEQPVQSSDSALKSLVLVVDTSVASFPLESPSALQRSYDNSKTEREDDSQDSFHLGSSGKGKFPEDETLRKIYVVAVFSSLLVLGSLSVAALLRVRWSLHAATRNCEENNEVFCGSTDNNVSLSTCFKCGCNSPRETDTSLLVSQQHSTLPHAFNFNQNIRKSCDFVRQAPYAWRKSNYFTHHKLAIDNKYEEVAEVTKPSQPVALISSIFSHYQSEGDRSKLMLRQSDPESQLQIVCATAADSSDKRQQ